MGKEIWKDIKGYEGFYQVSSCGRIRSLAFRRYIGKDKHIEIIRREKIMKLSSNKYGYLIVQLKSINSSRTCYVHRIVAEHFISNPNNKPEVNHKDFDKHNNSINNLEWATRHENINYSKERVREAQRKRWERYRANRAISNTTS